MILPVPFFMAGISKIALVACSIMINQWCVQSSHLSEICCATTSYLKKLLKVSKRIVLTGWLCNIIEEDVKHFLQIEFLMIKFCHS